MKKYLGFILAVAIIGCTGSDEPTPTGVDRPVWASITDAADCPNAPDWSVQAHQGEPAPQWDDPDYSLYSSSMMAIIMMPDYLRGYEDDDDLFAAFIGDEVRGIAKGSDLDGDVFYIFGIKANDDESRPVVFKYYSQHFQALFTADDNVKYGADAMLGSVSQPWVPNFTGESFCQAFVSIPDILMPHASSADKVAIYVGNECRGVGERVNNGIYRITASLSTGEMYVCRYYNARLAYVFDTLADAYGEGATLGTEKKPYRLAFNLTGKKPLKQTLVVNLPSSLAADSSSDDILAVFVGNECRGVASTAATGSFTITVRGKVSADEMASLRYYCAKSRSLYTAPNAFVIDGDDQTLNSPSFNKD